MSHVEHRLQALHDGELTAAEAQAVRRHCEDCDACGRALRESEQVLEILSAVDAPPLKGSVWSEVRLRVAERERRPGRLSLAGSGLAATAAGLALGLWFGDAPPEEPAAPSLLDQSAVWVQDSGATWDQIFLALTDPAEGETP